RSHTSSTVSSFGSLTTRHRGAGACPENGNEAVKDLEHKSYGKQLREQEVFSPEARRLKENASLSTPEKEGVHKRRSPSKLPARPRAPACEQDPAGLTGPSAAGAGRSPPPTTRRPVPPLGGAEPAGGTPAGCRGRSEQSRVAGGSGGAIMPREFELCPGRRIGGDYPCFIIAEIGQNHQGDLDIAKRMIRMAKDCGADCAKFQKSELEYKFNKKALERPYTSKHSWGKTYGEHKRHLEFSHDQYRELKKYAEEVGIFFTASGMDE
ncbi:uncharacterized protein LOC122191851, partial [Lagopus leucura]|uniref:uncharacterized protein LOC122191851 n=1 Tax=Lagopus leucura TaxID=30410 RepID=UPI001C66F39D